MSKNSEDMKMPQQETRKKSYMSPAILSRQSLEAVAGFCAKASYGDDGACGVTGDLQS